MSAHRNIILSAIALPSIAFAFLAASPLQAQAETYTSTTHTLTYDAMGGQFEDGTMGTKTVKKKDGEASVVLGPATPAPMKTGIFQKVFEFDPNGGTLTGESPFKITYHANSSSTKFLYWEDPLGVTYLPGSSYTDDVDVTLKPAFKDDLAEAWLGDPAPLPTRSGFVFDGWYTAADGGEKMMDAGECELHAGFYSGESKLYAHWAQKAKVTYKSDPYKFAGDQTETSLEVPAGTKISVGNGASLTGELEPSPVNVKLTFDAVGGNDAAQGKFSDGSTSKDGTYQLTRGLKFAGWKQNVKNGSVYKPGAEVAVNAATSFSAAQEDVFSMTDKFLPADPASNAGYEFAGWYTGNNATGTKVTSVEDLNKSGILSHGTAATLHAAWTSKDGDDANKDDAKKDDANKDDAKKDGSQKNDSGGNGNADDNAGNGNGNGSGDSNGNGAAGDASNNGGGGASGSNPSNGSSNLVEQPTTSYTGAEISKTGDVPVLPMALAAVAAILLAGACIRRSRR